MINVAVLGCGRIGQMHCHNLVKSQKLNLHSVYDVNQELAKQVGTQLNVSVRDSLDHIENSSEVSAVVIATSTDSHSALTERFAQAGKAIFCEKPLDMNISRAKRCLDFVKRVDGRVQLGFNRRFDPGHRKLKVLVEEGTIGDLHQLIVTSRDPGLPTKEYLKSSGGIFKDMTIHDFDICRFILGEEPVEIFAVADALIDPTLLKSLNDNDTAMVMMKTPSGRMAYINNSRSAVYGYDQRIEAFGSNGMLISGNQRENEVRQYAKTQTEASLPYLNFFVERYQEAFAAQFDSFADAIMSGDDFEATIEDGYYALRLAEAANLSLNENRPVRVDEVE